MRSWLKRLILGAGAVAAVMAMAAHAPTAQPKEIVIGVLYPTTGPTAQAGIDSKTAAELAVEIVNGKHDLDLPLARTEGLPNLGGAKPSQVIMPWKGVKFDPATGQNESGTPLITQWRGGQLKIVWPFDLASTDVLYPLPKWSERK